MLKFLRWRRSTGDRQDDSRAEPPPTEGRVTATDLIRAAKAAHSADRSDPEAVAATLADLSELHARLKATEPLAQVVVAHRSVVAVALLTPTDGLSVSVTSQTITFDWSEARSEIFELDHIAQDLRSWLTSGDEQKAFLDQVYALCTHVIGAVDQENGGEPAEPDEPRRAPSSQFRHEIALVKSEADALTRQIRASALRTAQTNYALGMADGGVLLGGLILIAGGVFWLTDVRAVNGVAALAGGLGAAVSVLQRMSSGTLDIDFQASASTTRTLGAVRPFLGAVLGMLVFVLLIGGLVPLIDVPSDPKQTLAFHAAIGFVAGFNERFAQDMLAGAAKRLGGGPSG
jgi:hypothetical protein